MAAGHKMEDDKESQPAPTIASRRRRRGVLGTAVSARSSMRISDISVTGAFLESYGEIPIGHEMELDLRLESGSSVRVLAKVVRVQYPDWGRTGGVGVTFTELPDRFKKTLAAFVDEEVPALK